MVVHACHLRYMGSINRRDVIQAGLGINERPHSKNTNSKKSWGCGSNGRAPVWEATGPEFKPYFCQKNFLSQSGSTYL
jgi:hypothetical protein